MNYFNRAILAALALACLPTYTDADSPQGGPVRGASLVVTTSDSSVALPHDVFGRVTPFDVVSNIGNNPMYCNVLGLTAAPADQLIPQASWFSFPVPSTSSVLHCIASGSSTTANQLGNSSPPTGAGGGGSGGGGGSNASVGTTGTGVPGSATYVGVNNGGNLTGWDGTVKQSTPGQLLAQVSQPTGSNLHTQIDASALPVGASTAAKQPAIGVAGTPSADILTVQGTSGMTALKTDSSATTQPVSAASLPLPAGASTSTNQTNVQAALNATAPPNGVLVGGLNSGNIKGFTTDSSGNLNINIAAGGASGGTSSNFGVAFSTQGTAIGFKDSTGTNMAAGNLDGSGNIKTAITGSLPAGSAQIGHVIADTGSTTAVTQATASNLKSTANINDGAGNALTSATRGAQQALTVQVVDASGNQVTTFGGAGGTASNFGSVVPTAGTASGWSDGTNMQPPRVFDTDSGAGTEYTPGVDIRLSGSGGSVEGGTATHPLRIDPTGSTTQPVSASQNGTWTVQPGNTPNTTPWLATLNQGGNSATVTASNALKVDGSAVTQPVSAASLPLPTGASTAAKQPALGTAGTASSDVITVQGITSMTALKVDGSGVTQPVSAASLPLPTGAATSANQTAITSGTDAASNTLSGQQTYNRNSIFNGTTWDRQPGTTSGTYGIIRDAAGNARGANVNAANQLSVSIDGSGVSNLSTNEAQINGVTPAMGNGTTSTGTQRVTISSDSTGTVVGTLVSPALTTIQSAAVANGNGTNLAVNGMNTAVLNVICSVACSGGTTINFEASVDNTTFVPIYGTQPGAAVSSITATTSGDYRFVVGGYSFLRARISAYSAGTITVKGYGFSGTSTDNSQANLFAGTLASVGNTGAAVPAAADYAGVNVGGNLVGFAPGTAGTASSQVLSVQGITSMTPLLETPLPTTTGGLTPFNLYPAAANDNHTVIKNGAGQAYHISVFNNSATINYLRLYDAGTGFNGCNSATNLKWAGMIPASTSAAGFVEDIGSGISFSTGISMCVTSGFGNTDTTNATATAIIVNIGYK